jgi:hypothetical protein
MTVLLRIRAENPGSMPQQVKDMLDKKVPYARIDFFPMEAIDLTKGTEVLCVFRT